VTRDVADIAEGAAFMSRLRESPPRQMAGFDLTVEDLSLRRGQNRTDALILSGGDDETSVRVVTRPSGTEPKIKSYIEVRHYCDADVAASRASAHRVQSEVTDAVRRWS
jgi:phosphomannomutase